MQITATVVFIKNRKVLLEKRRKDEDNYAGLWALPGGHKRKKETIRQALKREIREELKVTIKKAKYLGMFRDIDPTSKNLYHHHAFLVKDWGGKITKTYEQKGLKWCDPKKLPKNTGSVDRKILKQRDFL